MIHVLELCFPDKLQNEWREKLLEIIPSYGQKLSENAELTDKVRNYSKVKLELNY
jgi:malate dehydrogenase (quinone)